MLLSVRPIWRSRIETRAVIIADVRPAAAPISGIWPDPGWVTISTPTNPASTAAQRCQPVGSPRISAPRIVAKIGTVNCSVVASASGSSMIAVNRSVIADQPDHGARNMRRQSSGGDRSQPRAARDDRGDEYRRARLAEEQDLGKMRAVRLGQLDRGRHRREESDRQQPERQRQEDAIFGVGHRPPFTPCRTDSGNHRPAFGSPDVPITAFASTGKSGVTNGKAAAIRAS